MKKYNRKVVIQFDLDFNYINSFDSMHEASELTSIKRSNISNCAKFWSMGCNKELWFKENNSRPRKQAGGYIWRFYSDFKNRDE